MAASITIPTIFTANDRFSHVVSRIGVGIKSNFKASVAAVQRFDSKITKTFKKLSKVSQWAIGLGLGGLFTLAISNNIAYEDSLASVSAITGATSKELNKLEAMSMRTAKSQSMLGANVLKAYELIGSAKPELLENTKLLDYVTNATVTLSKAGRMELAPAAEALTSTLNQFGLGGEHANSVIDNLAAGAKYGSSSIVNTSDALAKFGTIAAATGTKVNESIALIELVSPFEKGAEAGTKLRNVLGKMAGAKILPKDALNILKKAGVDLDIVTNSTLPLGQRLEEMSKVGKDATDVMKVFGTENAALAQGIFSKIGDYDKMLEKIDKTGIANEQAATNTNTFQFALDSIKNSFLNTTTATQGNNDSLDMLKDIMFDLSKNMDTVVGVGLTLIGAFITLKGLVWGVQAATFAYNIAIGISAVLQGKMTKSVASNSVALATYKIGQIASTAWTWIVTGATAAWTAAQWLLNAALSANPIGLIIIGVIALIAVVVLIINKWDEWGAALSIFLGPLGMIISLIQSFRRNWDMIKEAFASEGILGGLKAIGKVILDSLLMPVEQLLSLIAKIPGMGDLAGGWADSIHEFRASLGVDTGDAVKEEGEVLPSTNQAGTETLTKTINEKNTNVTLDINDKGSNVSNVENDGIIPVFVSSTMGNF